MVKVARTWSPMHICILGLILGGLAGGLAEAGKPSRGPILLTGAGGHAETALFDSGDVLSAVQAESAVNPAVSGAISMSGVQSVSLLRGLEVNASDVVYAIFHASDTSTSSTFTGIVRYEDGAGVDVLLANAWDYEGGTQTSGEGVFLWSMDFVPAQDASASGPLQAGDLIVSRWIDDDSTASLTDGRHEIVLFRPDASGTLVEQQVLRGFDGVEDLAGGAKVAADCFGSVYLWIQGQQDTGGELSGGLYRFNYDSSTGSHSNETLVQFPFAINGQLEVDDAGDLYVQGVRGASQAGVIFQLPAGGDPASDYAEYATFTEDGSTESFTAWTFDNDTFAIAMSDLNGGDQDYVGLVEAGVDVVYADRIADGAPSGVIALTADAMGAVYVLHGDKTLVSKNQYAVAGYTVYRLDVDTSGGGGGKGGGKGKNK